MPASPVDPRLAEHRAQFGHRVAVLRQRADWTQERLAEASGFDRKTINRIENGRHSPSLDRVFVLAYALGVEPVDLFQWENTPRPRLLPERCGAPVRADAV